MIIQPLPHDYWTDGTGGVALDVLVTVLLWLAALLQTAVLRDRSIRETRQADASRWLVATGIAGLAVRFTFLLVERGDLAVAPYGLLPVALVAVGSIGLGLEQLRRPRGHRRAEDLPPHEWPRVRGAGR